MARPGGSTGLILILALGRTIGDAPGLARADAPAAPVESNRDIRPVLAESCFFCHGPDKGTRRADLRLDVRAAAVEQGPLPRPARRQRAAGGMRSASRDVDQASAALITDLKRRGMLDETLVIWGGEFGRTPVGQGTGRDHHILSFSVFLAGGGVKPGITYGATDELGYRAVEDVVPVRDLHATLLHLCGIDHRRLPSQFQGLDIRLTGVEPAHVLHKILA